MYSSHASSIISISCIHLIPIHLIILQLHFSSQHFSHQNNFSSHHFSPSSHHPSNLPPNPLIEFRLVKNISPPCQVRCPAKMVVINLILVEDEALLSKRGVRLHVQISMIYMKMFELTKHHFKAVAWQPQHYHFVAISQRSKVSVCQVCFVGCHDWHWQFAYHEVSVGAEGELPRCIYPPKLPTSMPPFVKWQNWLWTSSEPLTSFFAVRVGRDYVGLDAVGSWLSRP